MAEWICLPEGIDSASAWFIVASSLVTSIVGAVFGVGGGTILLALLAVMIPPSALIPVHGIVQMGATAGRAALLIGYIRRSLLIPFTVGTALGSALSGVLFIQFPPWLIQYAVAAFIVWSVFGKVPVVGTGHVIAAGAFSGFLTILFGATGPFVSAFVKTMGLPAREQVATHASLMTLQHCLKVLVFGALGFSFAPYALLIVAMVTSGFIGTVIGRHLLMNMQDRNFKPVLSTILLLLALRLAFKATEAAIAG